MIGNLYFVTSLAFFFFAGILALAIRAELAFPGLQYLSYETYNQFFTMHGAIMLLLFATPLVRRLRQRDHAAADRLARRRVPAAQHVLVLDVPVRAASSPAPAS